MRRWGILSYLFFCLCAFASENAEVSNSQPPVFYDESAPPVHAVCLSNHRTQHWAQIVVAGDLVDEKRWELDAANGSTNIAVLDTGFDNTPATRQRIASPLFQMKRGFLKAGDPQRDEDGHGTMVSGLIGADQGMGVAPHANLTVYRVTEAGALGSTSNENLAKAIKTACEDGNDIINVSWGGITDEAGFERAEVTQKKLIKELAEKGCLVTKSAGNRSYRKTYLTNDPDDAYLRVQATGPVGTLADFSSIGEVAAPGAKTFTLESTEAKPGKERCDSEQGRFANGTSFSAPLTAAVAGRIHGVLKNGTAGTYEGLSLPNRVTLIARILRASELGGSVNALRGGLIAKHWRDGGVAQVPTVKELRGLLESSSPPFCSESFFPCADIVGVEGRRRCVEKNRRFLTVCSGTKRRALLLDIIETYRRSRNLDLAVFWFRVLHREFFHDALTINQVVERLWDSYVATFKGRSLDFDAATELLPLYIRTRGSDPQGKEKVRNAVQLLLASDGLRDRLRKRRERGSEEDLMRVNVLLNELYAKFGSSFTVEVIQDWVSNISTSAYDFGYFLRYVRILDNVLSDETFSVLHSSLQREEKKLFDQLNIIETRLPIFAEKNPSVFGLSFFSDLRNFELDYLDGLTERLRSDFLSRIENATATGDFKELSGLFIAYLARNKRFISAENRAELFLVALTAISKLRGWGVNDWRLVNELFKSLVGLSKELAVAQLEGLVRSFEQMVSENQNIHLFTRILPDVSGNKADKSDFKELKKNPFLTKQLLWELSRRLIEGLGVQKESYLKEEQLYYSWAIREALPWLLSDPDPDKASVGRRFPEFQSVNYFRRFLPPSSLPSVWISGKTIPEMLEDLLLDSIEHLRKNTGSFQGRGLQEILSNHAVAKSISKYGRWRLELESLLVHLDQHVSEYGAFTVSLIKNKANEFLSKL